MKKRRKKKILGNDRFLMMLCRDARRRWLQYGENRKHCKLKCTHPNAKEVDHIIPLGPRPRAIDDYLLIWLDKMINGECELLCKDCHKTKTAKERKKRGKK